MCRSGDHLDKWLPDAINIAVADRLGTTLATFDERMATAARALGVEVAQA